VSIDARKNKTLRSVVSSTRDFASGGGYRFADCAIMDVAG